MDNLVTTQNAFISSTNTTMKKLFLPFLILFVLGSSCTQSTNQEDSESTEATESTESSSVDQLTYQDVVAMVYDDEGERIEWHGEEMPNDLVGSLSIALADPCGENDCGHQLTLTNTDSASITAIIRGDYDIEGDQGYIPRKYLIEGGATLKIGCSHLCYGGKGYEFRRTIVGSEYTKTE